MSASHLQVKQLTINSQTEKAVMASITANPSGYFASIAKFLVWVVATVYSQDCTTDFHKLHIKYAVLHKYVLLGVTKTNLIFRPSFPPKNSHSPRYIHVMCKQNSIGHTCSRGVALQRCQYLHHPSSAYTRRRYTKSNHISRCRTDNGAILFTFPRMV